MISGRVTLGALALMTLFVLLAAAVLEVPREVARVDSAVSAFLAPWRQGWPLVVFLWLTGLGTGATLLAVMATATALLASYRRVRLILPLWVTFLGTEAVTWGAKYIIDRTRPTFLTIATAASPAFPSAHSAGSLAVYGFLAYLVAREAPPGRAPAVIALAAGALILAIGFSRIFLTVHFLSDVVGGYLVAGEWLLVGCAASRGIRR
jgi:undecaprenyl-diphosphatase